MKTILISMILLIIGFVASPALFSADFQNGNSFTLADASTNDASSSDTLPDPALTGSNGDVGDPNDAAVNAAAAAPAPAPAPEPQPTGITAVVMAPRPQPAASQPLITVQPTSKTQSSDPNTKGDAGPIAPSVAFGNTVNGQTAFTHMLRNLMPLDPYQIITLRNMFDSTQKAVTQFPGIPPKPTSSSILVNMSPGATPPVIRLRSGYVTSLVFLDSTGQPWPVVGYDLGNPKAFNIQPSAPDGKSDTLMIQAVERYEQGNLAVMLKGENTPVMLTLMPGQRAVDYRVDLRIPGLGPNALVAMSGLPQTENPTLLDFLDGTPPMAAKALQVSGAPAQAWSYMGYLFVRARFTILSPGWIATMSSPDGTHVYELTKTPVILASQRGAMIQLSIKGL